MSAEKDWKALPSMVRNRAAHYPDGGAVFRKVSCAQIALDIAAEGEECEGQELTKKEIKMINKFVNKYKTA